MTTVVQSLHRAARVPGLDAPHDTVHVTLRHRASAQHPIDAIGTLAAVGSPASQPVVVIAPGTNVEPAYYRWLACSLVESGFAVATYAFVGPVPPEAYGITPGIDLAAVTPDAFGTRPVCPVIGVVLDLLAQLNGTSPLAGVLDLDRVALGGHSAGGTAALLSADHRWIPQVRAVFAYGAHTMASTLLGWPAGTVLPLTGDCPVLLVGGSRDGVIASSAGLYGEGVERVDPLARTFATLPVPKSAGSWLVRIEGANHVSILAPEDAGRPRPASDLPAEMAGAAVRNLIGRLVSLFLRQHLSADRAAGIELEAYAARKLAITATRHLVSTPALTTER